MSKDGVLAGIDGHDGKIQDFIFARELAEVYLLLDNVSTSPNKSLPSASTVDPPFERTAGDGDWIEEVCKIGWPPAGTRIEQAVQAAKLVKARDYLNRLAAPATGATIAFTLLVAGEDNAAHRSADDGRPLTWRQRLASWFSPAKETDGPPPGVLAARGWVDNAPSRSSLARLAFPGLVKRAAAFKRELPLLVLALFLWLVVTCVASWNVASGNAILARLAVVDNERTDVNKQMDDAANANKPVSQTTGQPQQTQTQTAGLDVNKPIIPYCDRHPAPVVSSPGGSAPGAIYESYAQLRICQRQAQVVQDERDAQGLLKDWLRNWRWLPHIQPRTRSDAAPQAIADLGAGALPGAGMDRQYAIVLAGVLGGTVLPVAYGILGAAAAVVRGLSTKMKESLLSPRDLLLSLVQLALGAVIGGCVGLFLTPSGGASASSSGLFGPVPLSASALSFIAGFGVESVFVALESLMSRVFNVQEPAKKAN